MMKKQRGAAVLRQRELLNMKTITDKFVHLHNYNENNKVYLSGVVLTEPQYSHTAVEENFYKFWLQVLRLSEIADTLLVTISERFFMNYKPQAGDRVIINGQYRSYNNYSGAGSKLILTVFAKNIIKVDGNVKNPNKIYLNGYVCKPPVYRITPFKREVADILLAVNRSYKKSDYIPCIAWGLNAKFAESLAVGTNICVWGRIQSRDYQKRIGEDKAETKTAYEVSISKISVKE